MADNTIAQGAVVALKSGSPFMTVLSVQANSGTGSSATCGYFHEQTDGSYDGNYQQITVPLACLAPTSAPAPTT